MANLAPSTVTIQTGQTRDFQMSITSSKISFGTQFKAHIEANHEARHLHLKKLGNKQKKEKVVRSIVPSTH